MFSISIRPEGIQGPRDHNLERPRQVTQPHEKAAAIVENARLCPIHHAGFAAGYLAPG